MSKTKLPQNESEAIFILMNARVHKGSVREENKGYGEIIALGEVNNIGVYLYNTGLIEFFNEGNNIVFKLIEVL